MTNAERQKKYRDRLRQQKILDIIKSINLLSRQLSRLTKKEEP